MESIPKINPSKVHHPNIPSYHREIKNNLRKSDIFVPEDLIGKIVPSTDETAGLISAHG